MATMIPTAGLARRELAALLDRALAALPLATRDALLAHHVAGVPQAALAARLGVREEALKVRLHRGRQALRRRLTAELGPAAADWGLVVGAADDGTETRIWCPRCGARRLHGRFVSPPGRFALRCPGCRADVITAERATLFDGITGYRAALTRLMVAADAYFRAAVVGGEGRCNACGGPLAVRLAPADALPAAHERAISVRCPVCAAASHQSLAGRLLCLPAGRAFWRAHPRLVAPPIRTVECDGRAALVVALHSVADNVRLEVVLARDTYRVLRGAGDDDA